MRNLVLLSVFGVALAGDVLFVCKAPNDLVALFSASSGQKFECESNVTAAVAKASVGGSVLVLAPTWPQQTDVSAADMAAATTKNLSMYIEYPAAFYPAHPKLPASRTNLERVVVPPGASGTAPLQPLRILNMHAINFTDLSALTLMPLQGGNSADGVMLALAKVAGYDVAVDGLPAEPGLSKPLLLRSGRVLLAATQLSNFARRRFAPVAAWSAVFAAIARFAGLPLNLKPGETLDWRPSVRPSFGKGEALPIGAERDAVERGVQWYVNGGMVPDAPTTRLLAQLKVESPGAGTLLFGGDAGPSYPRGDGRVGVLEGYFSTVEDDGRQPAAVNLRDDCVTETSMSFAMRAAVRRSGTSANASGADDDSAMARNLLNYAWVFGGFPQTWMPGTIDPLGDSFGLLAWDSATVDSATLFYKDDDARALLAGLATASLLGTDRWHGTIAAAVLGNLRLTDRGGFGPSSSTFKSVQESGWQAIYNSDSSSEQSQYSPHYQSYIWAVYLWAWHQTRHAPLYERAAAAIGHMMAHYPAWWQPTSNGITMQRARMLLPLAWLVRANDTATHRDWLFRVADGLLARQDAATGAIREEVSAPGWAAAARTPNNDDYGTFEAPLNQDNSDPVSDLLYTSNFAMLGLHEAAAATGNATLSAAAAALSAHVVRLQARSEPAERPELDGAFFRAFDFEKWEVWASDADVGWGAWSVETGWTQSWLTTTLGLRQLNTSLWELTQRGIDLRAEYDGWRPYFFPDPPPPPPCLNTSASTTMLTTTVVTSEQSLCAPAPGAAVSHVRFMGHRCGNATAGGPQPILWDGMQTVDPRADLAPKQCEWTAAEQGDDWRAQWTGGCGVAPRNVPQLSTHACV